LALYVLALSLPIHFLGQGEFSNSFPTWAGTRLTVGFLIADFTIPLIVMVGVGATWMGNRFVAAGIFLASGLAAISEAVRAPFYAKVRLQPMVLLTLWGISGVLFLLAAWSASRRDALVSPAPAAVPPPPGPRGTPAESTA
jgi:hypothetical protein